jgi:hypothetical protein
MRALSSSNYPKFSGTLAWLFCQVIGYKCIDRHHLALLCDKNKAGKPNW